MDIRNLSDKDVIDIEKFLKENIIPTNPLLDFRIFNQKEEGKRIIKELFKEAMKEVLEEREILETYRKLPKEG